MSPNVTDREDVGVVNASAKQRRAELAFEVYRALRKAERDAPNLVRNAFWRALQAAAFSHFLALFEAS